MTSSDRQRPAAVSVDSAGGYLRVTLGDKRRIEVPLSWYPRLVDATVEELDQWEPFDGGCVIGWAGLDEHVSVKDLLDGIGSGESPESFARWLRARNENRDVTIDGIREHERSSPEAAVSP